MNHPWINNLPDPLSLHIHGCQSYCAIHGCPATLPFPSLRFHGFQSYCANNNSNDDGPLVYKLGAISYVNGHSFINAPHPN